ncbi:hypothetical protein LSAT2_010572, partial [Lamellibrachia satsuma]
MELPPKIFADLSTNVLQQFVPVTGASSNHFTESIDGVASMQTNMPGKKIIYYDLGLKPAEIAQHGVELSWSIAWDRRPDNICVPDGDGHVCDRPNCNFGQLSDELIRDQLIEKTNNPRVRERLIMEPDTLTLEKAITLMSRI